MQLRLRIVAAPELRAGPAHSSLEIEKSVDARASGAREREEAACWEGGQSLVILQGREDNAL